MTLQDVIAMFQQMQQGQGVPPNPAAGGIVGQALAQHYANVMNEGQQPPQQAQSPQTAQPPAPLPNANPDPTAGLTPEQIATLLGPEYLSPEQRRLWQIQHKIMARGGMPNFATSLRALLGIQ
jgi:hypothetical protein